MNVSNYTLVETTRGLEEAAQQLTGKPILYIDTEFEQRGGETTLCLVQISSGAQIFLIDALRLAAMESLAAAVAAPGQQWVLHSAKTDIELLLDKLQLPQAPQVFDTQVAWALLGAEYSVSLAYLNYQLLGERMEKEHQADPWVQRPIPDSQLAYAARDIATLPELRQKLLERLAAQQKEQLAETVSREFACQPRPEASGPRILCVDDFRNAWELDYGAQAALQFLIDWWNAPESDRPGGMKPYVLFQIARRMPASGEELARIKGVPHRWARKHGDLLTGRMMRASYEADEQQYPAIAPKPYLSFEEVRIDAFLNAARYAVSRRVAIAPEICFPSGLLQEELRPRIFAAGQLEAGVQALREWRQDWLAPHYTQFCGKWQRLEAES